MKNFPTRLRARSSAKWGDPRHDRLLLALTTALFTIVLLAQFVHWILRRT